MSFTKADFQAKLTALGYDITIGAGYPDTGDASDAAADFMRALNATQADHNATADGVTTFPIATTLIGTGALENRELPPGSGTILSGYPIAMSLSVFDVATQVESYPNYGG